MNEYEEEFDKNKNEELDEYDLDAILEDYKPKPKRKEKDKDKYYVNPSDFKNAISEYYNTGICTNYLGECLNKIAEGLGYNGKFINYSYKEDMIGDALIKMFSALKRKKFDINGDSSPFGYFTTIAFHAFINRIKKEKKHHDAITQFRDMKYEEIMSSSEGHIYVKPILDYTGDNLDDVYFDSEE